MTEIRKGFRGHLAAEIAAAIMEGAYRPGEWLRQIDLEEIFAAKRSMSAAHSVNLLRLAW
jgi:DNA-binding GntR family transcriptional regulator